MPTKVKLSSPGYLYDDHADGYERTIQFLDEVGINARTTDKLHALRTYQDQVDLLYTHYTTTNTGLGPTRTYDGKTWWRKSGHPTVAQPGKSNHQNGNTVDFQNLKSKGTTFFNQTVVPIMLANGWDNTEGAAIDEYWHWTRNRDKDKYKGVTMLVDDAALKAIRAVVKQEVADGLGTDNKGVLKYEGAPVPLMGLSKTLVELVGGNTYENAEMKYLAVYLQSLVQASIHDTQAINDIEALIRALPTGGGGSIDLDALEARMVSAFQTALTNVIGSMTFKPKG